MGEYWSRPEKQITKHIKTRVTYGNGKVQCRALIIGSVEFGIALHSWGIPFYFSGASGWHAKFLCLYVCNDN